MNAGAGTPGSRSDVRAGELGRKPGVVGHGRGEWGVRARRRRRAPPGRAAADAADTAVGPSATAAEVSTLKLKEPAPGRKSHIIDPKSRRGQSPGAVPPVGGHFAVSRISRRPDAPGTDRARRARVPHAPPTSTPSLKAPGVMMMVVNSVCGCAAGKARPGIAMALQHAEPARHRGDRVRRRRHRRDRSRARSTSPASRRRRRRSRCCATASCSTWSSAATSSSARRRASPIC